MKWGIFLFLFTSTLISGCLGTEKAAVPPETTPAPSPTTPHPVSTPAPITAEDLTIVGEKESLIGGQPVTLYDVEYKWEGTIYKAGNIRKVEGELAPFSDAFSDMMAWIKENTPNDATVLSWWDYGHFIRLFASRETVVSDVCDTKRCLDTYAADKSNIFRFDPTEKVEDVARFFTSNEEEAYQIAQNYGVDYVIVTYEEFGKSGAINHIANDNLRIMSFKVQKTGNETEDQKAVSDALQQRGLATNYIVNKGDHYLVWYLKDESQMRDKMLAKLLPFNTGYGQGLEHFNLVYQNGYIYLYEVV
jgi:hydroxylamine oxidation protein HaoB